MAEYDERGFKDQALKTACPHWAANALGSGTAPEKQGQALSRIWAEAEAAGKMTCYYDLIVAATARQRGIRLATFNRRHFEHIR